MEDSECELVSLCEVGSSSVGSVSVQVSDTLPSGVREASHKSSHRPIPHSPRADPYLFFRFIKCIRDLRLLEQITTNSPAQNNADWFSCRSWRPGVCSGSPWAPSRSRQRCVPSGGSGGESLLWSFPASRGRPVPLGSWLCPLSSEASLHLSDSGPNPPASSFTCRHPPGPCKALPPSHHPSLNLEGPSRHVRPPVHRFWGLRCGHRWRGPIFCPPHSRTAQGGWKVVCGGCACGHTAGAAECGFLFLPKGLTLSRSLLPGGVPLENTVGGPEGGPDPRPASL